MAFRGFSGHDQRGGGFASWLRESRQPLPLVSASARVVNRHPSGSKFSAVFSGLLCFLLVIFLFEMAPKCSANVTPGAPQHQETVMHLVEKMHIGEAAFSHELDNLSREFNIHESLAY